MADTQELFNFYEGGEHVIRHGEASPIRDAKELTYSGRLDTPRQFHSKKTALYEPLHCTFVVDKEANRVTFYGNEKAYPTDGITGSLLADPNLAKFKINSTHRWSTRELWQFLKEMGYYFADPEQHKAFLASLRNFQSKVQVAVEAKHDDAGNKRNVYERVVQENSLSENPFFKLRIPLYKGYDPLTFQVELGFDPTDAGVSIFLLSEELYGLLLTERDRLMATEEDYFTAWGCAIITKS